MIICQVSLAHGEILIGLKFHISCILNIKCVLIGCILALSLVWLRHAVKLNN